MKALIYNGTPIYQEDYPMPVKIGQESLVKVLVSAVCNTDKEILKGYKPDFSGVMGHEFVGVVEQSNQPDLIGQRVVGELNHGCGNCIYCKTGRAGHCNQRTVLGLANKDGCFAEYMTISTDLLHRVPDSISSMEAVFTEPLAAALEITSQIHILPDTPVAVLGDGRLSFLIAQIISLTGADLTVVGRHPEKLAIYESFAKTTTDLKSQAYEIVIDATGSPSGIITAQNLVRKKGLIVLKSTYAGTVELNMSRFVVDEISLVGSRCGPFEPALHLLERKLIKLPPIELYPLVDFEKAFTSQAFKTGFLFS